MKGNERLSIRPSNSFYDNSKRLNQSSFQKEVKLVMEQTCTTFQRIWDEAGYDEIECQGIYGNLLNKLKQLCETEIANENQILEHAKSQLDLMTKEYYKLCEYLGRSTANFSVKGNNYADKLADIDNSLNLIQKEIAQRSDIIENELKGIVNLFDEIGTETEEFKTLKDSNDLTDARLNAIKKYMKSAKMIHQQHVETFNNIANDCFKILKELLLVPVVKPNDFPIIVNGILFNELSDPIVHYMIQQYVDSNYQNKNEISLHNNMLNRLRHCYDTLLQEKKYRMDELANIGAEIARLWTLLRIPTSEREDFQTSFEMNLSSATIEKGRSELRRLQDIRVASFGKVINAIRTDILACWDELSILDDEIKEQEFPLYFHAIEKLNDDAVDVHETYLQDLRGRIEELRPLLSKISRRETVVQERIELYHIQLNPERLTARGPNAREDRKREEAMSNRVKNLDKITKEILASIQSWESLRGQFMYAGERYLDRIVQQEEAYTELRESLKNSRKKKDGTKSDPSTPKAAARRGPLSSAAATMAGTLSMARKNDLGSMQPGTPIRTNHAIIAATITASALAEHENRNNNVISTPTLQTSNSVALKYLQEQCMKKQLNQEEFFALEDSCRVSDATQYTSLTEVRERESVSTMIAGQGIDET